jgi:hypothetical protein
LVTDWQQQQQQPLAKSSVAASSTGRRGGSSCTAGSEGAGAGQLVLQLRLRPSIFLLPVLPPEHQLAWLWSLLMLFMDMVYVAFIMPTNMVSDCDVVQRPVAVRWSAAAACVWIDCTCAWLVGNIDGVCGPAAPVLPGAPCAAWLLSFI